jgi:PEP-CTERM motif
MKKISLVVAVVLCATFAHADTFYNVTGTLTIQGNDACNGSTCTEVANFSFVFDESPDPYNLPTGPLYYYLQIIDQSFTSTGPLTLEGIGGANDKYTSFGFSAPGSDGSMEVDVFLPLNFQGQPFTPELGGAAVYGCGTLAVCVTDFCQESNDAQCSAGYPNFGPVTLSDTITPEGDPNQPSDPFATPEPGTLSLLTLGLAAISLFGFCHKHHSYSR